jgi:L-lysine 2,3-aminomutase
VGVEIGFKIYNQICLKRGITERPYNLNELLKNIKSKVFKHLFNYEITHETNTYRIEERKAVVVGLV